MRKLRDADAMLHAGKDEQAVPQALEVSQATHNLWRKQYVGMKAEEAKVYGITVVTHEVFDAPIKKIVPLPNVCRQFRVTCIETFTMPRQLGIVLKQ